MDTVDEIDFAAQIAAWYEGKSFTSDWTSGRFPLWTKILKRYRNINARVLEIGSWEGRSALFFLNYLTQSQLVCIETFAPSQEYYTHLSSAENIAQIEQRFDANLANFAGRVEKIKAPSQIALADLAVGGRSFDIAYIDGGHRATDVYSDGILTWPMMVRGGMVIFDDYLWEGHPDPLGRPKAGIDSVLNRLDGQYHFIHRDHQIVIEKI